MGILGTEPRFGDQCCYLLVQIHCSFNPRIHKPPLSSLLDGNDLFNKARLYETLQVYSFLSCSSFNNALSLSFPQNRTIIEWSESHDRGYGKFQTARMEDFTFNDLNIKLGFPYLYCHQGDCEHVVVITDIRYVASLGEYFILKSAINWGWGGGHMLFSKSEQECEGQDN